MDIHLDDFSKVAGRHRNRATAASTGADPPLGPQRQRSLARIALSPSALARKRTLPSPG